PGSRTNRFLGSTPDWPARLHPPEVALRAGDAFFQRTQAGLISKIQKRKGAKNLNQKRIKIILMKTNKTRILKKKSKEKGMKKKRKITNPIFYLNPSDFLTHGRRKENGILRNIKIN
ncbi:hypothetical protein PFDG_04774, partial [Plasmodium falciparum Dd2]